MNNITAKQAEIYLKTFVDDINECVSKSENKFLQTCTNPLQPFYQNIKFCAHVAEFPRPHIVVTNKANTRILAAFDDQQSMKEVKQFALGKLLIG